METSHFFLPRASAILGNPPHPWPSLRNPSEHPHILHNPPQPIPDALGSARRKRNESRETSNIALPWLLHPSDQRR